MASIDSQISIDSEETLRFDMTQDLKNTFPIKMTFLGNPISTERSWSLLFLNFVKYIYVQNPDKLIKMKGIEYPPDTIPILLDKSNANRMRTPAEFAPGLMVELNKSPESIVSDILLILYECHIESNALSIVFKRKKAQGGFINKRNNTTDVSCSQSTFLIPQQRNSLSRNPIEQEKDSIRPKHVNNARRPDRIPKRKKSTKSTELFAEVYGLHASMFNYVEIDALKIRDKLKMKLKSAGINTLEDLLKTDRLTLIKNSSFNSNFLAEIDDLLNAFSKNNHEKEMNPLSLTLGKRERAIFVEHKEEITKGDFSFAQSTPVSDLELAHLNMITQAYDYLGKDIVSSCIFSPCKIAPILKALSDFYSESMAVQVLIDKLDSIPESRKHNSCKFFIEQYTSNISIRNKLFSFFKEPNSELISIKNYIESGTEQDVPLINTFLEWCCYDLKAEVRALFNALYAEKNNKVVLEAKVAGKKLREIGDCLSVSRERIRQIEIRVIRLFYTCQTRIGIIGKLYADKNGQKIISQEEIEEVGCDNANVLLYLLKQAPDAFYHYDNILDAFVVNDNNFDSKLQDYLNTLPDIIHKSDSPQLIEVVAEELSISKKISERVFFKWYKAIGDIYVSHKESVTLDRVIEEILQTEFPSGINVYDGHEMDLFKSKIIDRYGLAFLPATDLVIINRIRSIGISAGNGLYVARRDQWISKPLESQIYNYIIKNDSPTLSIEMIFTEYENELFKEGITSIFLLYGVLKELFENQFYFRPYCVSRKRFLFYSERNDECT